MREVCSLRPISHLNEAEEQDFIKIIEVNSISS